MSCAGPPTGAQQHSTYTPRYTFTRASACRAISGLCMHLRWYLSIYMCRAALYCVASEEVTSVSVGSERAGSGIDCVWCWGCLLRLKHGSGGWANEAMLARGWGVVGPRGRAPSWLWETLTLRGMESLAQLRWCRSDDDARVSKLRCTTVVWHTWPRPTFGVFGLRLRQGS